MSHDDMYLTANVRTDAERRADWSCVQQISPDNRAIVARLVELEDERVHLLTKTMRQADEIDYLKAELKLRDAA